MARAWRRVDRTAEAADDRRRHASRVLHTWVDDDGMVVIRGRLAPEVGAVVRRARSRHGGRPVSGRGARGRRHTGGRRGRSRGNVSAGACCNRASRRWRRPADARGQARPCGQRPANAQVVARVSGARPGGCLRGDSPRAGGAGRGRRHPCLSRNRPAAGLRRRDCRMQHGSDGQVLDVGRKTRTISPALRRALAARDWQCRFPGCQACRCDAHHIRHWRTEEQRRSTIWCCSAGRHI